jgi:hypothetical protein
VKGQEMAVTIQTLMEIGAHYLTQNVRKVGHLTGVKTNAVTTIHASTTEKGNSTRKEGTVATTTGVLLEEMVAELSRTTTELLFAPSSTMLLVTINQSRSQSANLQTSSTPIQVKD